MLANYETISHTTLDAKKIILLPGAWFCPPNMKIVATGLLLERFDPTAD